MSLTSYRAAPPRVEVSCRPVPWGVPGGWAGVVLGWCLCRDVRCLQAWQRPTLPRLETKYHWRWGFSRPSSGWDRVFGPPPWPPGRRASDRRSSRRPLRGRCCPGQAAGAERSIGAGGHVWRVSWRRIVHAVPKNRFGFPTSLRRGRWRECEPIERLVPVSCTRCRASTSGLST